MAKYPLISTAHPAASKCSLTESTVKFQRKNRCTDLEFELKKKRGCQISLTEKNDNRDGEEYAGIWCNITPAVAAGVITANEWTLVKVYGGTIKVRIKWCVSIYDD